MIPILQNWKTETQRGDALCPRSHSQQGTQMRFKLKWSGSDAPLLYHHTWHMCGSPGMGSGLLGLASLWPHATICKMGLQMLKSSPGALSLKRRQL